MPKRKPAAGGGETQPAALVNKGSGGGLFSSLGLAPSSGATTAPALAALFSEANAFVRKPGPAAVVKKAKAGGVVTGGSTAAAPPTTPDRAAQAARAAAAAAAARAAEQARGGRGSGDLHGLGRRGGPSPSASEDGDGGPSSSTFSDDAPSDDDDDDSASASASDSSRGATPSSSSGDDDPASGSEAEEPAPAPPPPPRRDPAAEAARLARTVFVSNVSPTAKRKALAAVFSAYGPVEAVRLRSVALSDKGKAAADRRAAVLMAGGVQAPGGAEGDKGRRRGGAHAYVVFASPEAARAALAHNMREVDGLHVRVDMAAPPARSAADAWAGRAAGGGGDPTTPARPLFDKARSVFVGNLPPSVEDEAIIAAFGGPHVAGESGGGGNNGVVTAVRCVRDARTGEGRGVAFVELVDKGAAAAALARNGTLLDGRPLRVTRVKDPAAADAAKKARERAAARAGGGASGRGGGRGGGGGRGRGRGRGGPPFLPPGKKPTSTEAFQGVRTKGGGGKVSGGAAAAPRPGRGRGRGGSGGGRGRGRGGRGGPPPPGPRVGKRPAVAERKAKGKKSA